MCKRFAYHGAHRAGDERRQHRLRDPAGSQFTHHVCFNIEHASAIGVVRDGLREATACAIFRTRVADLLRRIKHPSPCLSILPGDQCAYELLKGREFEQSTCKPLATSISALRNNATIRSGPGIPQSCPGYERARAPARAHGSEGMRVPSERRTEHARARVHRLSQAQMGICVLRRLPVGTLICAMAVV